MTGRVRVRYRVLVTGRVQGVWYRQSCRQEAEALGVGGWVRNRPDGAVEAAVEGDPAAVGKLLDWMRTGPPGATVVNLGHHEEPPTGDHTFRVR